MTLDVWDEDAGFISLGKFAPEGSVLLWPHIRFSQVSAMLFILIQRSSILVVRRDTCLYV